MGWPDFASARTGFRDARYAAQGSAAASMLSADWRSWAGVSPSTTRIFEGRGPQAESMVTPPGLDTIGKGRGKMSSAGLWH